MVLSAEQIKSYHENGYLVIDNLFSKDEAEMFNEEALKFNHLKELPNIILEKNGDVRSVFAPHRSSKVYDHLYKQDRLVGPAKQLLGDDVYLYQYKLNNKKAFTGDWWEWHQDFPYWHLDDGVDTPLMTSVMILLQDTSTLQGPLIFIPKSHKDGIVDFEPKEHLMNIAGSNATLDLKYALSADLKYTIKRDVFTRLINEYGFFEFSGTVGTCIFFHPNIFHASNANISPYERNTAILTYNSVNNLPMDRENNRPDYICLRDFEPIKNLNTF